MENDVWVPYQYAECTQLKAEYTNEKYKDGFRLFRSRPDVMGLQIRAFGPINDNRNGKPRMMIATVHLTKKEIKQIYNRLGQFLEHNR